VRCRRRGERFRWKMTKSGRCSRSKTSFKMVDPLLHKVNPTLGLFIYGEFERAKLLSLFLL